MRITLTSNFPRFYPHKFIELFSDKRILNSPNGQKIAWNFKYRRRILVQNIPRRVEAIFLYNIQNPPKKYATYLHTGIRNIIQNLRWFAHKLSKNKDSINSKHENSILCSYIFSSTINFCIRIKEHFRIYLQ